MYNDHDFNLDLLRGMNAIIISMNDEDAYSEWIFTCPDCVTEDDFEDMADDQYTMNECIKEFMRIYKKYSKYGLFVNNRLFNTGD